MQNLNKKKQNHTSHIAPHTSQKGITLIALIITIIVMLILVGVTINVALNGGLFQKAEQATKGTEEKAILEEMLAMMEIDNNGKFMYDTIISNMKTKHPEYTITYSYPNATVKGKLGTYNYIVSETEIKIGTKEIKPFNWEDVGLIVDTNADYEYSIYTINFTKDGKIIIEEDGKITTIDATDPKNIVNRKISFPFEVEGTPYNTTLIMNENNTDIDAVLEGFTTVTYEKKQGNVNSGNEVTGTAYGTESLAFIITSDNRLILYTSGTAYNGSDMGYSLYTQKITNHENYTNYTLSEDIRESTKFIFNSEGVAYAVSPDGNYLTGLDLTSSAISSAGKPQQIITTLDIESIINSLS